MIRPLSFSALAPLLFVLACSGPAPEAETGDVSAPLTVAAIDVPGGDRCASVVRPLAQAAAESTVGLEHAKRVEARLVSETEVREYEIFVDGPEFTVNGQTFPNDWTYTAVLDNDSASMCVIQSFGLK